MLQLDIQTYSLAMEATLHSMKEHTRTMPKLKQSDMDTCITNI